MTNWRGEIKTRSKPDRKVLSVNIPLSPIPHINYLPPVFMKSIADYSQISSNNTNGVRKYTFSDFMDPPDRSVTIIYTFRMTDVIRQNDEEFKNILSSMRKGTLIIDQCTLLTNRCLSKLDNRILKIFDNALHLVNQCNVVLLLLLLI